MKPAEDSGYQERPSETLHHLPNEHNANHLSVVPKKQYEHGTNYTQTVHEKNGNN